MRTAIGIDFGGTTIKFGVVRGGVIVERGNVIETVKNDAAALIAALIAEVMRLAGRHPETCAIGIGLPGIVDSLHGVVHRLSNVPGWNETPLRDLVRRDTGLFTAIENDANAMAYGEWKYGAAMGGTNVVCITLGTGVGGGLILDGRLFRGSSLGAGEAGQMSIDWNGVPGNYGNLGALEKYVGNQQIAGRAQEAYTRAGKTVAAENCTPLALGKAALAGDEIARGLWTRFGEEIGAGLVNVIWLLNPDCTVIGGGVAQAGELLFEPIRRTIRARTMPVFYERLRIVPATLGTDAGIIGGAQLALDLQ